ncbi:nucleotidyltransferase family protein [Novosphingobium colocasiae]|uniref:nucleotidyltransferase family protein n=1 Tax=Novosphingobium colocasiae TaxID=1256513 RepID=UPI0035B1497E
MSDALIQATAPTAPALASDTAMVLAAGLGKRMRPLTATQPKPLVRVAGKSLVDHALDKLDAAGVVKAVVNVHYLADALEGHFKVRRQGPAVTISDERTQLLETGGGMVAAQALLPDPFFCLNSDNIWLDGPRDVFAELSAAWDAERMDALLLMVPHPRAVSYRGKGDFHLDSLGRVRRRRSGRVAPFIFTGIQLVSHRLLRDAPEGPFSTNVLWDRAIDEGRLYGICHQGIWLEVGEPSAIAPAEAWLTGA